jgi:hypothetical protein
MRSVPKALDRVLDDYLRKAGNKIGNKLFLDKNGLCVLKKQDDNQEYAVELPKNSEIVYFYAPICKVPCENSEEFFEKILELNLCGMEYNQATFGLDAKTQNIVLSYTRSMNALDEVAFANIFYNFIRTVDRARKDLLQLIDSFGTVHSFTKEYTAMGNSNLGMKNGQLKV